MKKEHLAEIRQRFEEDSDELQQQMFASTRIDPDELNDEFIKLASVRSYWSALTAQAHRVLLRCKVHKKQLRGLLRIKARKELEAERGQGARNVTESMVDNRVDLKEEWLEAEEEEIEAEVAYEAHKGHLLALAEKRDMLMQLGAQVRAEMGQDPSVREEVYMKKRMRREHNGEEE